MDALHIALSITTMVLPPLVGLLCRWLILRGYVPRELFEVVVRGVQASGSQVAKDAIKATAEAAGLQEQLHPLVVEARAAVQSAAADLQNGPPKP